MTKEHGLINDPYFAPDNVDVKAIKEYNKNIRDGIDPGNALVDALDGANEATLSLATNANGAEVSLEKYTVKAKLATTVSKGLALAGNMLVSSLISIGISFAIQGIMDWINSVQNAKEAMKEAQQAIDDAQNSLKNITSTLDENKERFLELSEGVDKFSKNLTLSEEEYKEYLDISQQLAEIFPELVVGYDEQGNALLNIGNNAEETNAKLEELLETEQKIARQTLIDNMDDVAKGIAVEAKEASDNIKEYKNQLAQLDNEDDYVNVGISNSKPVTLKQSLSGETTRAMETALKSAGIDYGMISQVSETGNENVFFIDPEATKEQLQKAQDYYDAFVTQQVRQNEAERTGLLKKIAEEEQIYKNHYSKMSANLQAWVSEDFNYQYLSESSQKFIDAAIPNIDWSSLVDPPDNALEYQDYITKNIIEPLMSIPEEHQEEIDQMLSKLFSFEPGDIDIVEFALSLQTKLKEMGVFIDVTPVISDEQTTYDKLQNVVRSGAEKVSGISYEATTFDSNARAKYEKFEKQIDIFAKQQQIDTEEEIQLFNEAFEECNGNIDRAFALYLQKIRDIQEQETIEPATITSTVQQMAKQLEPQFAALGEAYTAIFHGDNGFDSNVVDNAMLEELRTTFAELEEDLGVSFNPTALENFFSVLADGSFTADEAQNAFNDLATAWFYGTNTLDNLNKETANAIVQQMEKLGVTNAQEIVEAKLAETETALAIAEETRAAASELLISADEVVISSIQKKIQGYLLEAGASEAARLATFQAIAAEQIFGSTSLNCSEKIQELNKLAGAYLSTAQAARLAAYTKGLEKSGMSSEDVVLKSEEYLNQMMNETVKLDVDFDMPDAGSAGGAAGDAYVEEFEKALSRLQDLRDQGKISEKQYLSEYRKLYERYFKDIEKYAEEFAKHQHEYLSGMKSLYESVFSAVTSIIDKQIDQLEKQRDATIDSYEEQKEAASEYYEKQIEEIDKEIEKIEDATEARKNEMDMQKALYSLIRSQNQRTIKTLDEYGNTVYRADPTAVRDNQDSYQDAKDDYAISKLEKQREEYERLQQESDEYWQNLIDETNEYYDNLIQGLEEYKSRWEELAEMEEQAKMLALLEEFGYTEEDILNMSEDAFQNLKKQYLQVLKDMNAGNGGVLKHLSDISGVDMTQLEGHLQATADTTADFGEELETVSEGLDSVCDKVGNLNETFDDVKGMEAYIKSLEELVAKMKEASDIFSEADWYNGKKNPYTGGIYDTTGKGDKSSSDSSSESSSSSANSSATASTLNSKASAIVLSNGVVLTPVNTKTLNMSSLGANMTVPNNYLNQMISGLTDQVAKSITKTNNSTRNVQLSQSITINAPYLTNESGYNRLMDEFKGLTSEALVSAINNKK